MLRAAAGTPGGAGLLETALAEAVQVQQWSDTSVIVQVPAWATSGPVTVVSAVHVFCGGCLVVGAPSREVEPDAAARLAAEPAVAGWPLVVVSDEPERAVRSAMNFLWTTFTRFEPAADIHAAGRRVVRNHLAYEAPIVIDARLKPGFPAELACRDDVAALVTRRWRESFPSRAVEMGDAERAHLD